MINHARTLLLNMAPRDNHITADTGAEYVPAEFSPVNLPNELRLLRRTLFGSKPDMRFINLRVRELMGYIHQTEFAHYVYDLDPRVTYWPTSFEDFDAAARSQIVVTQMYGPPQRLTIVGTFQPNHSVGVSMHKYTVTVGTQTPTLPMTKMKLTSPDTANTVAVIQQLGTTANPVVHPVGSASSGSTAVLPQTELKLLTNFVEAPSPYAGIVTETEEYLLYESYDSSGGLESEQLPADMMLSAALDTVLAQWFVTVKAVPKPVITTLLPTLELLGEPVFLNLFGVDNVEPYATFKNLWFDHYAPAYRLAGLTLAMIYRTNELYGATNG